MATLTVERTYEEEASRPQTVVDYVAKRQGSFEVAMNIIRWRQEKLAEALGVGEDVPFPRLIKMIREMT